MVKLKQVLRNAFGAGSWVCSASCGLRGWREMERAPGKRPETLCITKDMAPVSQPADRTLRDTAGADGSDGGPQAVRV